MTQESTTITHNPGGKVRLAVPDSIRSSAVFSTCQQYRYELHREWDTGDKPVLFFMMNPSTATEHVDDPTVKKCRGYAERWGYNHLIVVNMMAYRATNPKVLLTIADPIGPDNHTHIKRLIHTLQPLVICAWGTGTHKKLLHAEKVAMQLLVDAKCAPKALRVSALNKPWHPLYIPNDIIPMDWIYVQPGANYC